MKAQILKILLKKYPIVSKAALLTLVFVLLPFSAGCFDYNSVFEMDLKLQSKPFTFEEFAKKATAEDLQEAACSFVASKSDILRTQPLQFIRCKDTIFVTIEDFSEHFDTSFQIQAAKYGIEQLARTICNKVFYTNDIEKAFTKIVFAYPDEPIPPIEGYIMNDAVGFAHYPPSNPKDTIFENNGYAYINEKFMTAPYPSPSIQRLGELIGHEVGHTFGLKHNPNKGTMMFRVYFGLGPLSKVSSENLTAAYKCTKICSHLGLDSGLDKPLTISRPFALHALDSLFVKPILINP